MATDTPTSSDPLASGRRLGRLASPEVWARLATHGLAIGLVAVAVWLARVDVGSALPLALPAELVTTTTPAAVVPLVAPEVTPSLEPLILEVPAASPTPDGSEIVRKADVHTIIPTRPRYEVETYTVVANDTLFIIASKFNLEPETILWGNPALADNPNILSVGQELNILPINGALRVVQPGDTIEKIAKAFHGTVEEIINFPGNNLDASEPQLVEGQSIIIPGGWRDSIVWQLPVVTRTTAGPGGASGEPGACSGPFSGPSGTFTFAWPANNHYLSGTDYLPQGHPGVDIAAGLGAPIYASDTGVIVFAGLSYRGYGNLVIIDHGNGWQTAYAHLSQINVACGGAIYQGQVLGLSGSTGNSTGPHLHFEMRSDVYGRVNPWLYLP
ncbi:MAG: M23 family metallopeptidase [Anaerolineales bacterium]|nr:M23 family metallopeptidase [Anaerolineales bacterium]